MQLWFKNIDKADSDNLLSSSSSSSSSNRNSLNCSTNSKSTNVNNYKACDGIITRSSTESVLSSTDSSNISTTTTSNTSNSSSSSSSSTGETGSSENADRFRLSAANQIINNDDDEDEDEDEDDGVSIKHQSASLGNNYLTSINNLDDATTAKKLNNNITIIQVSSSESNSDLSSQMSSRSSSARFNVENETNDSILLINNNINTNNNNNNNSNHHNNKEIDDEEEVKRRDLVAVVKSSSDDCCSSVTNNCVSNSSDSSSIKLDLDELMSESLLKKKSNEKKMDDDELNKTNDHHRLATILSLHSSKKKKSIKRSSSSSSSSISKRCLYLCDILLAITVFSPLVGIYWYCSWTFLDKYFFVGDERLSNFLSYAIGLLVLLPSYLFQQDLKKWHDKLKRHALLRFVFRNVFLFLISFAFVLQWRGLWNICDMYLFSDDDWLNQFFMAIGAILFFCAARSTGSLVSTPFILYRDDLNDPFTSESRFKFKCLSNYAQYLIDFILSELIECFILVLAWRGIGNLYDQLLFKDNVPMSVLASFSVSHCTFLVVALSQTFIIRHYYKLRSLVPQLIVESLVNLVMFLSCVLIWKFYWDVIDNYLHSDTYELPILIVGHVSTFVLSIFLKVTFLLAGPGTSISDNEQKETKIYFKLNYMMALVKKRKLNKRQKQRY